MHTFKAFTLLLFIVYLLVLMFINCFNLFYNQTPVIVSVNELPSLCCLCQLHDDLGADRSCAVPT